MFERYLTGQLTSLLGEYVEVRGMCGDTTQRQGFLMLLECSPDRLEKVVDPRLTYMCSLWPITRRAASRAKI